MRTITRSLNLLAVSAVAALALAGCSSAEKDAAPASNTEPSPAQASASATASAEASTGPASAASSTATATQEPQHTGEPSHPSQSPVTAVPEASPTETPVGAIPEASSTQTTKPEPVAAGSADVGIFKTEITEATLGKVESPIGHERPGSPAVRVTLKLTNTGKEPANASTLSFPIAVINGQEIPGGTDTKNPDQAVFGVIAPTRSQELEVVFPTDQKPQEITLKLADPANPNTTHTITHSVR
ncbi:hypothetical protein VVR12_06520 [Rothia sp. LK2588]|uniref:hypothetical protein n=1 Tax=Rothia sp. LK2588 TaxID=3114369 RepID=UPI0034CE1762